MRILFVMLATASLVASCGSDGVEVGDDASLEVMMEVTDASLYAQMLVAEELLLRGDDSVDAMVATQLLEDAQDYVRTYREGAHRLEVMDFGVRAAHGLGKLPEEEKFLRMQAEEFYDHDRCQDFMYLRANVLLQMGSIDGAERVFNDVIQRFPDSQWAEDSKAQLITLRMTDTELIEYFESLSITAAE